MYVIYTYIYVQVDSPGFVRIEPYVFTVIRSVSNL